MIRAQPVQARRERDVIFRWRGEGLSRIDGGERLRRRLDGRRDPPMQAVLGRRLSREKRAPRPDVVPTPATFPS